MSRLFWLELLNVFRWLEFCNNLYDDQVQSMDPVQSAFEDAVMNVTNIKFQITHVLLYTD